MANREELEKKNKSELQEQAKEQGLEGYSSMNKDDLVAALADENTNEDAPEGADESTNDAPEGRADIADAAGIPAETVAQQPATREEVEEALQSVDEGEGESVVLPVRQEGEDGVVHQVKQVKTR